MDGFAKPAFWIPFLQFETQWVALSRSEHPEAEGRTKWGAIFNVKESMI
jgi:hypothetical protein